MANKIIVTADCVVAAAQLPSRAFTTDEEVQPTSPYYYILLWSGLANDTGVPEDGTDESVLPLSAVIVQVPRHAGHDYSVRWSASQSRWIIFDQETEVEALVSDLAPAAVRQALLDSSVSGAVITAVDSRATTAVNAKLTEAGVVKLASGLPTLATNLHTRPRPVSGSLRDWSVWTSGASGNYTFASVLRSDASTYMARLYVTTSFTAAVTIYPTGTSQSFYLPVDSAKVVSQSVMVGLYGGAATHFRLRVRFLKADYTIISTEQSVQYATPPDGKLRRYYQENVRVPAEAAFIATDIVFVSRLYNVNDYVVAADSMINEGPVAHEYFDGDTQGCVWLGTATTSRSARRVLGSSDAPSRLSKVAPGAFLVNEHPEPIPSGGTTRWVSGGWGGVSSAGVVSVVNDGTAPGGVDFYRMDWAVASEGGGSNARMAFASGSFAIDVTPGEVITVGLYGRASDGSPLGVWFDFYNENTYVMGDSYRTTPSGRTDWQWVSKTMTVPVGVNKLRLMLVRETLTPAGATLDGTLATILRGDWRGVNAFYGGQPGCYWLGEPSNSPSALIAPREGDVEYLVRRAARVLEGVGSPEGVLAATVGTEYLDTSAANGAIKWTKVTGVGSTGWRVTEGDTSWRVLTSWNAAGVVSGIPLGANFGPRAGVVGNIQIRRKNERVYVRVHNLSVTAAINGSNTYPLVTGTPLPGFRGEGISLSGYIGGPLGIMLRSDHGDAALMAYANGSVSAGGGVTATIAVFEFFTDNPWPTTLPGTPA